MRKTRAFRKNLPRSNLLNHNGKNTMISSRSQPRVISRCDVDIDSNYDLDAQTEFELGLMELYNRLGMSEHDLNFDINSDVPYFVDIHGLTVVG